MSVKHPVSDLKDNNYLSVKATLNRCVFRRDLRDDTFLISFTQSGGCNVIHTIAI